VRTPRVHAHVVHDLEGGHCLRADCIGAQDEPHELREGPANPADPEAPVPREQPTPTPVETQPPAHPQAVAVTAVSDHIDTVLHYVTIALAVALFSLVYKKLLQMQGVLQ
jgi:hypothetical protein